MPSTASAPTEFETQFGDICKCWMEKYAGGWKILHSLNGGASVLVTGALGYEYPLRMTEDGDGTIYITYSDEYFGTQYDYSKKSTDAGATWSTV